MAEEPIERAEAINQFFEQPSQEMWDAFVTLFPVWGLTLVLISVLGLGYVYTRWYKARGQQVTLEGGYQ